MKEPDCYAAINNGTGESTLFVPRFEEAYRMWMYVKPLQEFKIGSCVQNVRYVDEIEAYIQESQAKKIFIYSGVDTDSGIKTIDVPEKYLSSVEVDRDTLFPTINNLRVIKTEEEIELLRFVCKLSTDAHIKVMRETKAGLTQIQMHALFNF